MDGAGLFSSYLILISIMVNFTFSSKLYLDFEDDYDDEDLT